MKLEPNVRGAKGSRPNAAQEVFNQMFHRTLARIALTAAFVVVLAIVPSAIAAKDKGKPGGGTDASSTLSLKMVYDQNADGAPNWNDRVTFGVYTTATSKPWVKLNCYQAGAWVSTSTAGFFAAYPWAQTFTLASGGWTSGAGDCTATLYLVTSNGRSKNLTTLSFHVDA